VKNERAEPVEKNHPELSVRTQCEPLEVPRSSPDYRPVGKSEEDRNLIRLMEEIYLIDPCIGTRRLVKVLGWRWSKAGEPVHGGLCGDDAANRRSAGGIQNRPRQAIHQLGMDGGTQLAGNRHHHGGEEPLDGQGVHPAALAQREARGHLTEGIREPASVGGGTGSVV
jgi:putative transposase